LDSLENAGAEKMLYGATAPTIYFIRFWMISRYTWWQFSSGHSKREVRLLGVFFLPSSHIWQGLKRLFTSAQAKKGGRRNNNSFGVQEGAVTTSEEYLQRGVRQGLCVGHVVQRKVRPNQLGPSEEKM
jgi:hypothetical protein